MVHRRIIYWIKFTTIHSPNRPIPPERLVFDTIDEMWHRLREMFLREGVIVEWMVRDYD